MGIQIEIIIPGEETQQGTIYLFVFRRNDQHVTIKLREWMQKIIPWTKGTKLQKEVQRETLVKGKVGEGRKPFLEENEEDIAV